ncbi:MAG: zinc-binding dehydrogenase [Candidatus Rokubacteria bacterium]|nr:zinc-binding dehydrogenase [Candidatus Rokubacteria bacterium]
MKVGTWRGSDRFTVDDVPEPSVGPGQALVDVQAAGICGTDIHATQGLFPWTPPLIMGHEYTGVIRDVGRGVSKSLIGRAVACEPSIGCGRCPECAEGRISQCQACTRVGGFAQRVALPVVNLHPLPKDLDPVTAALAEPAACCLAGLEQFTMPKDATVVVMGGGIMGLLTMAIAKHRGAKRLVLSDPIEDRRAIAKKIGANVVIDPVREDLRERVMTLTKGRGADVVCEAVGKPTLVAEALAITRPMGRLQLVGVNPKGSTLALDLFDVHYREIQIGGAFGRGRSFKRALALLPKLGVKRLVTARYPLLKIAEAFEHATAARGAKTVITPNAN